MSETASSSSSSSSPREPKPLSELLLAGVGWASLGAEVATDLADELSQRFGIEPEEMRGAVQDALKGLRDQTSRGSARTDEAFDRVVARWGLVRRDEVEELALRVAQLEHRLALLERTSDAA